MTAIWFGSRDCGSSRQLFLLTGGGEAVEIDDGNAVNNHMADLHDALQSGPGLLAGLLVGEQFWRSLLIAAAGPI